MAGGGWKGPADGGVRGGGEGTSPLPTQGRDPLSVNGEGEGVGKRLLGCRELIEPNLVHADC
jgi:hypothetical protein